MHLTPTQVQQATRAYVMADIQKSPAAQGCLSTCTASPQLTSILHSTILAVAGHLTRVCLQLDDQIAVSSKLRSNAAAASAAAAERAAELEQRTTAAEAQAAAAARAEAMARTASQQLEVRPALWRSSALALSVSSA
jgi:hypothetical protein